MSHQKSKKEMEKRFSVIYLDPLKRSGGVSLPSKRLLAEFENPLVVQAKLGTLIFPKSN